MAEKEQPRTLWQDEAERAGGPVLITMLLDVLESQKQISSRLAHLEALVASNVAQLGILTRAFPEGDIEGHARYHKTIIQLVEEKRRLRIAIQEKTISGLIWACIIGIGVAVANQIKFWLSSGPH
jgi:hypothetical protein